jgi:tetratricopeptide (TPR) repeat protein
MRLLLTLVATLLLGTVSAQTLVIYPFGSQDALAGIAVADRIAAAIDDAEVLGPEIAPGVVPPMVVAGGFLNPVVFLDQQGFASPTGAALLQDATGADLAVTGELLFESDEAVLQLYLDGDVGESLSLRAPFDQLGRLADLAASAIAARLGVDRGPRGGAIDLSGPYGDHVRAIGLVGAGLVDQALAQLEDLSASGGELLPETEALIADLRAVAAGEATSDPALGAVVSINSAAFDELTAIRYQERFRLASALPVADVWTGALAASINDRALASEAFARAADTYAYGTAARASYRDTNGLEGVDADLSAIDAAYVRGEAGPATLLGVSLLAQGRGDIAMEKRALQRLGDVAPFFVYPFERLSFIAFDEEDGMAASEAMAVAVELDPDSDLYWTNYGWALYLVGLLDQSEAASLRATLIDPTQFIAFYNLGLSRVVTGRLELAMDDYGEALRFDPEVDDEAIFDLENALTLYPDESAIHFALATMYQSEGRRSEAADQYELYVQRSAADAPFTGIAARRVDALRAPPPPIEIAGAVELSLGRRGIAASPYHPGEDLYLSFEVLTPGESLPELLSVSVALVGADGARVAEAEAEVEVPQGAIGFVIDDVPLPLPPTLAAGSYRIELSVLANEGRAAIADAEVTIEGAPELLRQLLGRNVVLQELESGLPLVDERDLVRPEVLTQALLAELARTADAAEGALPVIESGRFEGQGGGQLFRESIASDIEDFVTFLLRQGTAEASFTFVDAYAQWALEGAPSE